jgi:starvation-inducible DNA-binding protein
MTTTATAQPQLGAVIDQLNGLLADSTVFYQKLRNYHWFVTGPQFFTLHAKFEELYDHWAEMIDEIAERILAMNGRPLPTLAAVLEHAGLNEETGQPNAKQMVQNLHDDMNTLADRFTQVHDAADEAGDTTTVNLLDEYIDEMRKTLWMLRAWATQ